MPSINKWFKNIRLFRIIAGMFLGFLLLALTNYLVIKNYIDDLAMDTMEIDAAGRTRMLSQKIIRLANNLENEGSSRDEVYELLKEHDDILDAFKTGGMIGSSNEIIMPVTGTNRIVLNQTISFWDSIQSKILTLLEARATIDTTITKTIFVTTNDSIGTVISEPDIQQISIPNPVITKTKQFLSRNAEELLVSNNRFVQSLAKRNEVRLQELYNVLLGFLLFNSICIIAVLFATKRFIFGPLRDVATTAKRLAEGDVGVQIQYSLNNELGNITNGLNHLSSNLENSRIFIEKIEKGELDKDQTNFNSTTLKKNSIESALIKMRDQMQVRSHEDERRNWTTQGLAKFVDILRSSENVNKLGDAILSNLTEYTNSNQAGLYLLNKTDESNSLLELVSLYAFNSKKYDTKSYRLGEGLVGQTFLEKKTNYFIDVPDNYISITSGLGDANPSSLLLVPLKVEEEVHGVIEIASFNEYKEHEIQFIEKLAENIASTIAIVKSNARTKLLLEESQQLTEQMQAQEEEMRQNMEELTATQEEMARKENSVKKQLDVINDSIGIIEYSVEGDILLSNKKINDFLGFTEHSIAQTSFQTINKDAELLSEVKKNKSWSGWCHKINFKGDSIPVKSQFNLVTDENDNSSKIIEIIGQFEQEKQDQSTDHWSNSSEIEEELQQNLDALEITQEQLNIKLTDAEAVLEGLKSTSNIITYTSSGKIVDISPQLQSVYGDLKNINEIIKQSISELIIPVDSMTIDFLGEEIVPKKASIRKLIKRNKVDEFMIIWS